jgi:hypothetical protein
MNWLEVELILVPKLLFSRQQRITNYTEDKIVVVGWD